jgi:3-methyladenine DNA glycosylase AlkC
MADPPKLKDFVDSEAVARIAGAVDRATDGFDQDGFVTAVFDEDWETKALKVRIRHIARTLRAFLAGDYPAALDVLLRAAHGGDMEGFSAWCLNDFVEEYGIDDPDLSLPALEQFTRLVSAEFAVRPFIARYPERMATQMVEWARSDDEAVRRLASEGYRPRLPWGMGVPALKKDPSPILPVLELLHDDPSETVRRSVANNLNDISKDHPGTVLVTLADWEGDTPKAVALRKHALRTLLKKGDPGALELLGFSKDAPVAVAGIVVSPETARIGEHVFVEFQIVSTGATPQPVMVDYAVVFQNRSGTGSRKVFKGRVEELDAGGSLELRRKVSLRPMSTREIFPGRHIVEVQVNGVVRATAAFDVVE